MEIFHFSWGIRTQTGDILICLTKPIHTYSCTVHEYMQFICQCCMQSITGFWLVTIPANNQTSRSQGMGICAPGCETYRDSGSLNCIEMTSVSHLSGGSSKNVQDIWEGAGSHYAREKYSVCIYTAYRYVCTTQQIDSPGLTLIDQRSVTTLSGFIKKG